MGAGDLLLHPKVEKSKYAAADSLFRSGNFL